MVTEVMAYDRQRIKAAILRELNREWAGLFCTQSGAQHFDGG